MVSPLNYIIDTPDPLSAVMDGFEAGTAIRRQPLLERREAEDRARLQVERAQSDTLFGQQQDDRAAAQAAAQQQQAEAQQMRADMEALRENPNATAADFTRLAIRYPQIGEELRANWDIMDASNKDSTFRSLSEIYAAITSGNPDVAETLLSDRAEAMRNSGRADEAAKTEVMIEVLRADPNAAEVSIGLAMASVNPDKFTETFSTIENQRRDRTAEVWTESKRADEVKARAAALDLSAAQTNKMLVETANMTTDAAMALIEFRAAQERGGATPEDQFSFEDKLRKEYIARIGTFPEARVQFDKLNSAANVPNAETGAGDVALIFSFMKMLDPGSVVRESEFALAQDTAGLMQSLQNSLQKANNGEFMSRRQRNEMVALAGRFMEAAQAEADRVQADLMIPVTNYGLSPENVFGVSGQEQTPEPAAPGSSGITQGMQDLLGAFPSGGN